MSCPIVPHKYATLETLPPELIGSIIDDLPLQTLAALRLCWPHLNGIILPRLFRKIHFTFAERHLERLEAVASTSHIAPHVQELVWITSQTRETHNDLHGHIHTDVGFEAHVKHYRRSFLACVDALPNLHTFTSELGPESSVTRKQDINGLVYAFLPALCRPQSRITSLRCQDPLNYMRWLHRRSERHPATMFKSLPRKHLACKWRRVCVSETKSLGHRYVYEWASALRGLVKLDLQTDTIGGDWCCREPSGTALEFFLESTVNLRELSVRWRCTSRGSLPGRPLGHSGWSLENLFNVKWHHLRTIKLSFVQITFLGEPFKQFIARHATSLRHILLHNCRGDLEVLRVIEYAARNPEVKLHRFAVFPAYESHPEIEEPRIILERLVLNYINSKDPLQNPFGSWDPSGFEYWGTIAERAESLSIKWPEENGMHFRCRQCTDD
ncbi:hypothetical protein F66182_5904 [Fusarium sp. NRRL 66182]|nr:hypothetical protein F66182_5904 [Fusarium sp. NRRL 66182]